MHTINQKDHELLQKTKTKLSLKGGEFPMVFNIVGFINLGNNYVTRAGISGIFKQIK